MQKPPGDDRGTGLEPWKVLARQEVAHCRVFKVMRHRCRLGEGNREDDFYVIDAPDWVVVLPITPGGEMVMVRQYRFGGEDFFLEFPAGVIDPGEDPIVASLRELREETGYVAEKVRLMGSVRPNPALQNNTCHYVLAEGVRQETNTQWDEHEQIEVLLLPIEEVIEQTRDGRISHALAINALYFFYPFWGQEREL